MQKWTSVESIWDVISAYTVCWTGIWLLCALLVSLSKPQLLVAFDMFDYIASLTFLTEAIVFAMILGLLFSVFYLGFMKVTVKLWWGSRLKANAGSIIIAILLSVLVFLLLRSIRSNQPAIVAMPFAFANTISGFVTVRLLPKMIKR